MAKIIKNKDGVISIGTDDGGILEVTFDDLDFIPNVGDEVEVFRSESNIIVNKVERKANLTNNKIDIKVKGKKIGLISFILSFIGFVLSMSGFVLICFASLILGIISLIKKEGRKWMAISAILVSLLGLILSPSDTDKVRNINKKSTNLDKQQDKSVDTDKYIYEIGEVATRNDIRISLNGYIESAGNEWGYPKDGNEFIFAEFEIANKTDSEIIVNSLLSFDIYCDNYKVDFSASALTANSIDYPQIDGNIAPDKILKGNLGIEVPIGWKQIEIYYRDSGWTDDILGFVINK